MIISPCLTIACHTQMCSAIPHGKVSTYGAMAAALQSSARAVGQVRRCALHDSQAIRERRAQASYKRRLAACVLCGAHHVSLSESRSKASSATLLAVEGAASQEHQTKRSAECCLQALRRNPWAPGVPCHRVVAANLELGGFDGDWVSRAPSRLRMWHCHAERATKTYFPSASAQHDAACWLQGGVSMKRTR